MTTSASLLVAGCGSESKDSEQAGRFDIDDGAGTGAATTASAVPDESTTLSLKTGAQVAIPAGAVDESVSIGLKRASDKDAQALVETIASSDKIASAPYVLTPHGTQFKKAVEITLPINKAVRQDKLAVVWLEDEQDTSWEWLGKAKVSDGKATIQVEHFSVLLLVETDRSDEEMSPSDQPAEAGTSDTTLDGEVPPERDASAIVDSGARQEDSGVPFDGGDADGGASPADAGTDLDADAMADAGVTEDGGSQGDASVPPPAPVSDRLYVIHNGSSNAGTVDRRNMADLSLAETGTFTSGGNRGAAFVPGECDDGYFVQVGDDAGIRLVSGIYERSSQSSGGFDLQRDREIGAASIASGRDVVRMQNGLLAVSDYGASNIKVFAETAASDALPLFTLGVAQGSSAWGLAYDSWRDRLFAALSNGSVAVYDYVADGARTNRSAPDRSFSSNTPYATRSSYRGIAYDESSDMLVVSDVGAVDAGEAASFASDGSLVVFAEASALSGAVAPTALIAGPATHLGNPVDLHIARYLGTGEGSYPKGESLTLFVADNGSDQILQFVDFFNLGTGNVAPTATVQVDEPEALTGGEYVGNGWACGRGNSGLIAIAHSPGVDADAVLESNYRITFTETMPTPNYVGSFDTYQGAEPTAASAADRLLRGLTLDQRGHAIFSFNGSTGPGLTFVHSLRGRMGSELDAAHLDRTIQGSATNLVDPRGLYASGEIVFVADPGAGDIKAFSLLAGGDVAPLFVIENLAGAAAVNDVAFYRYGEGTLYAAASDGRVLAYDGVLANHGVSGPSRVLSFGASHASALVAEYNTLFVADPGVAGAADGAIYRIDGANTANGTIVPAWVNRGGGTLLVDPVDLVLLANSLWVADQADRVSSWESPSGATLSGVQEVPPSATFVRPAPVGLVGFYN